MNKEDGKKIVDEKTIAREIFGEPGAHSGTSTCGGGRVNYCVWCSGPVGYGGAYAYQICRDIYGRETLITSPEDFYEFCFHEEYKEEEHSYTQPTSTYGSRRKRSWGLDYETREKVLIGLGIYFLVIAPVLVVLPPVLIYYHFISTAMNPLWIGLFLVNFIGAMVYYVLTYNEVPKLSLLGEVVLIIYLLLGIVFAAISLPLMYYGYQALTN